MLEMSEWLNAWTDGWMIPGSFSSLSCPGQERSSLFQKSVTEWWDRWNFNCTVINGASKFGVYNEWTILQILIWDIKNGDRESFTICTWGRKPQTHMQSRNEKPSLEDTGAALAVAWRVRLYRNPFLALKLLPILSMSFNWLPSVSKPNYTVNDIQSISRMLIPTPTNLCLRLDL